MDKRLNETWMRGLLQLLTEGEPILVKVPHGPGFVPDIPHLKQQGSKGTELVQKAKKRVKLNLFID